VVASGPRRGTWSPGICGVDGGWKGGGKTPQPLVHVVVKGQADMERGFAHPDSIIAPRPRVGAYWSYPLTVITPHGLHLVGTPLALHVTCTILWAHPWRST
jgi:hypothetical protein